MIDKPASSHYLSGQRIIVAGAGIAGLAYAIALRKQWPSVSDADHHLNHPPAPAPPPPPKIVVYERDSEENAVGREGYSMSIRSDAPGGIQALHKLGLLDAVCRLSISAADEKHESGFCMWDKDWKQIVKMRARIPPGVPVGALRLARNKLRGVLVESAAQAGCEVIWNTACSGIARRPDGTLEVLLSNGTRDSCDLLIAADGANSKIRAQIRPLDKLDFRQTVMVTGTSRFDGPAPKPVDRDWGMLINGTGIGLFASPVDDRSALWAISYSSSTPVERMKQPLSDANIAALMAEARAHRAIFPPLFGVLLDATDPSALAAINIKDKEPFAHTDSSYPDVIFIGDANHAVSPFAGNGANMALSDGWDLAELLCSAKSIEDAVKSYDKLVVPRSRKVWKQSHFNIAVAHAVGWRVWLYLMLFRILAFFQGHTASTRSEPEQ